MIANGTQMAAAVYRRFGGPEVVRVEQIAIPVPARDEVLVKVHASTVSVADHRSRTRSVPRGLALLAAASIGVFRPRNPVLGMDVAGTVEAVGADVTLFAPGDEVVAMLGAKFGGHAEYATVPQFGAIAAKPRNLTFDESVALVFGGSTAHGFLSRASIGPGTTVLVNGASGAVGSAAVQLAAALGADVTGVCSGANRALVESLGAHRVIDYTRTDFLAEGRSYDVIVECVGNAPFEKAIHSLRPGGALLLVISDLAGLLLAKGRSKRSGRTVIAGDPGFTAEGLARLVRLAESGRLQPVIDRTYDLAEIAEAHRYVDTGRKKGNVILRMPAISTATVPVPAESAP
jgi:NADPH:quinone reductase-like Zn-dependent oxidoreductase